MDISILKDIYASFMDKGVPQLAASLSYYALFSLAPLLIITTSLASLIFKQSSAHMIVNRYAQEWMGEQGAAFITRLMNNSAQLEIQGFASLVSAAVLLWGATSVFNHVHYALNQIFEATSINWKTVLKKRTLSFLMVFGTGILLIIFLVLSTFFAAADASLPRFFSDIIAVVFLGIFFTATYRMIPDRKVSLKSLLYGAFTAAILFLIGKFLITFYISQSNITSLYGATGSLLALLLWIYYSAQIFFLGAVIAQVLKKTPEVSSQS